MTAAKEMNGRELNRLPTINSHEAARSTQQKQVHLPVQPVMTISLIAVNAFLFLLQGFGDISHAGALNQTWVLWSHEYYRLVTSMFLHVNFLHFLLNMIALYSVGRVIEGYIDHTRFLLVYFLGGLIGSIAAAVLMQPDAYALGASGAIFALFGAELVFFNHYRDMLGPVAKKELNASIRVVVLNLIIGLLPGLNIENWAHVGGLLGGMGIAYVVIASLFKISAAPDGSDKLICIETHPRALQTISAVSLVVIVLLMVTIVPTLSLRTITAENITLTLPTGSHIVVDLDRAGLADVCNQPQTKCLLAAIPSETTFFFLLRLSSTIDLYSFEQFDEACPPMSDLDVQALLQSQERIQVSGRDAIRCLYQNSELSIVYLMLKDKSDAFVLIGMRSNAGAVYGPLEATIASIRFVDR